MRSTSSRCAMNWPGEACAVNWMTAASGPGCASTAPVRPRRGLRQQRGHRPISGQWCYCWPSATPIGPVTCLTQAAETIIDELGIDNDEDEDEDGRRNVTSLAVGRMLRQARLEISRPPVPAGPAPGHCLPAHSAGRALAALRAEMDARGMATAGMTITRLQGTMTLAGGPAVSYRCGWLFWPACRPSLDGRPLYAAHRAQDPADAARRLALPGAGSAT
jgi:hypothetical protein